jgi:hypothetical protein
MMKIKGELKIKVIMRINGKKEKDFIFLPF